MCAPRRAVDSHNAQSSRVGVSEFVARGGVRFASIPRAKLCCVLLPVRPSAFRLPPLSPPSDTPPQPPALPCPPRRHASLTARPPPRRPRPPPTRRCPGRPQCRQQCHRPRRHMEQQLGSVHGRCESHRRPGELQLIHAHRTFVSPQK